MESSSTTQSSRKGTVIICVLLALTVVAAGFTVASIATTFMWNRITPTGISPNEYLTSPQITVSVSGYPSCDFKVKVLKQTPDLIQIKTFYNCQAPFWAVSKTGAWHYIDVPLDQPPNGRTIEDDHGNPLPFVIGP